MVRRNKEGKLYLFADNVNPRLKDLKESIKNIDLISTCSKLGRYKIGTQKSVVL
jgi:hypothetical protein